VDTYTKIQFHIYREEMTAMIHTSKCLTYAA